MRAVTFKEPFEVAVANVPDAHVEDARDVVIEVTTTNICGSDLHVYEGRAPVASGQVLGHETMGTVVETGVTVEHLRVGDRVSVPCNIACGTCVNCERGFTAHCLTIDPAGGGVLGYTNTAPYAGGQAEYLRVPYGDFNCLRLPSGTGHEADYAMLADAFPTGYHATELADVRSGESVAVFGAGPVGLLAAYSAVLRGASEVFCVDEVPDRLALASHIGATPIDYSAVDPVERILDATDGVGATKGIEAVGWRAHDADGEERPELPLNQLVACVSATGAIGMVGVFVPRDERAPSELARRGRLAFDAGRFFQKGLRISAGQCDVKAYNRRLRDLITDGRASPSFLVSHELGLEDAPAAYRHVDERDRGWTKVVLHPEGKVLS
jgi:glutathione-independent formaldehyde dehydrogenase